MKFRYMNPDDIISVIIVLITLGIGIYAFFVATTAIINASPSYVAGSGTISGNKIANATQAQLKNATMLGGTVFNILGVIITIGAIMMIIGVIYGYLRPKA